MNRSSYIKIMTAVVNLIAVLMVEAGKVPVASATKIADNILKAIVGKTKEQIEKEKK